VIGTWFRASALRSADEPRALTDTRGHVALEVRWVRLRLLHAALSRGESLAACARRLGVAGESALDVVSPAVAIERLEARAHRARCELDARIDVSPPLAAHRAISHLGLDRTSRALLGTLLACDCDAGVAQLIASQGRAPGYPTLAALADVVGCDDVVALARAALDDDGHHAICEVVDAGVPVPLCETAVRLRPRLRRYLLELAGAPESLRGLLHTLPRPASEFVVSSVREAASRILDGIAAGSTPWLLGNTGSGRRTALALAAEQLGRPLLVVAWSELVNDAVRLEPRLRDLELEARLTDSLVALDWRGPWSPFALPVLARLGRTLPGAVAAITSEPHLGIAAQLERAVAVRLEATPRRDRVQLIHALLVTRAERFEDAAVDELAEAFALNPGEIHAVVAMCPQASTAAQCVASYRERAFALVHTRLAELAQPVATPFSWDDLVVDDEAAAELRAIIAAVRYRRTLFDTWGLGRVMPYGRGVHAIFSGPPGTGKTMGAAVVAATMGRQLFRIDVSQLVSKYIGETEKNIGRIFDAAAGTHAVLFFDEADSMFARRTEVRSHHDRHANTQTGYLLQRMEQHDGVTILATNLIGSIDTAFARRIPYRVEFTRPSAAERATLWRRLLAPPLPTRAVDVDALSADFELSGAQIKNAIVRAGLTAASNATVITDVELRWAATLERRLAGAVLAAPTLTATEAPARAAVTREREPPLLRDFSVAPDGSALAISADDAIRVVAPGSGEELAVLPCDGLHDFAFVGPVLWVIDRDGVRRLPVVAGARDHRSEAAVPEVLTGSGGDHVALGRRAAHVDAGGLVELIGVRADTSMSARRPSRPGSGSSTARRSTSRRRRPRRSRRDDRCC
jgi:AAA+ superfamily predicted ATPase